MARSMTPDEKKEYKALFPKLDVDKAVVTGENSAVYNCLAWTLDITTSWIWPGPLDSDFDRLYGQYGYQRASNGPIAAWGISKSEMTHGSISGAGHGPRWESKCGRGLRIQHGLTELEGVDYGKVLFFYDKAARSSALRLAPRKKGMPKSPLLSSKEMRLVGEEARQLSAATRSKFNDLYDAWLGEREAPEFALQSDPRYVRHLRSYKRLAGMGPEIIPLVLNKMAGGDFLALQLYEALQENPSLIVQIHRDERVLGGEQLRAAETVRRWLSR